MAEGLGAAATLPDAVSLIVPDAADWALIHMLADHGGVSRAVAHRDPAIQADIERIHARIAFNQDMPYGPAQVMRTGESSFNPRVRPEVISTVSRTYPEYAEILQRIGLGSQITVPLRARKTTLGALTLGRAARRPYTKAHLSWAEDLGHRIGLAVENARLYNEARQLFEQTLSANYVSTPGGQILACNQSFAALLGFDSPDHLVKHPAPAFYPNPDERERAVATLRTGPPPGWLREHRPACRRGTAVDLGECRRNVRRPRRAGPDHRLRAGPQQREEPGGTAAAIAAPRGRRPARGRHRPRFQQPADRHHRLRASSCSRDPPTRRSSTAHDALDELSKAAEARRGADATTAGVQPAAVLQPRVLDLNERLRDVHTMLRRLVGEDIELVLELDPDSIVCSVDPGQLEQVIVNLVVNARDAMPNGGTLTIDDEQRRCSTGDAHAGAHPYVAPGPIRRRST